MKRGRVFVLLAPGFEESDVSTVVGTLRKFGFPVTVVGLTAGPVRGAYGLSLAPDATLSEVETVRPQAVVLPGGVQGARRLNVEPRVHAMVRRVVAGRGYVLALDAACVVLRSAGVLEAAGEDLVEEPVSGWGGTGLLSERVVVEGPVVFGPDSGSAQEAVLTLVTLLKGGGWTR